MNEIKFWLKTSLSSLTNDLTFQMSEDNMRSESATRTASGASAHKKSRIIWQTLPDLTWTLFSIMISVKIRFNF